MGRALTIRKLLPLIHRTAATQNHRPNLVPRAFSSTIFKMADRREKTLAKAGITWYKISKNLGDFYHVTFWEKPKQNGGEGEAKHLSKDALTLYTRQRWLRSKIKYYFNGCFDSGAGIFSICKFIPLSSLRSKRFRRVWEQRKTEERGFRYFACAENGARAKNRTVGVGEGKERTACGQTPGFWKLPFAGERGSWLAGLVEHFWHV